MSEEAHGVGLPSLLKLPASTLANLAIAFRGGQLRYGVDRGVVENIAGSDSAGFCAVLRRLAVSGSPPAIIGEICSALAEAKRSIDCAKEGVDLVLSGPEVPGFHVVDTATVARTLLSDVQKDVIICSYVFFLHRDFFAELAARHDAEPGLRVRVLVDISSLSDGPQDATALVANRFRRQFLEKCWNGTRSPEFFYDPRAFEEDSQKRGVMHAKGVIVDDTAALITSANFTDAAQSRNIEAGVLLRDPHQVKRLKTYFEALISTGKLTAIL
jgi:phosphatidylserine/phosphatidylglycerophosphate/cardiolipin synthase-like enzyme